jgi:hypothetical protein
MTGARAWTILVLGAVVLALLASWVPHYVTWPWWADPDAIAVLAQSWDAGIVPYRDIAAFNFPGQTYLMFRLGKLFGWGHTWAFYALDATFVMAFGLVLLLWSRRRFGTIVCGLAGYAAFLGYYLNLDYSQVAQRDWQAPFFVVTGLLLLDAWPRSWAWVGSAIMTAAAVTIRPHVVVLAPAIGMALYEGARGREDARLWFLRSCRWWSLAFLLATIAAFAPLMAAGVFDDFVRSVFSLASGGQYSRATWMGMLSVLGDQLRSPRQMGVVLGVGILTAWSWRRGGSVAASAGRVWLAAFAGTFFYKAIHPVYHDYLAHPTWVAWSVNVAVLAAFIEESLWLRPAWRAGLIIILAAAAIGGIPAFCSFEHSFAAISERSAEGEPVIQPLGYARRRSLPNAGHYPWGDYRSLLAYLRRTTSSNTRVANVLKGFPAINGPTGRLSPFPIESGLVFVWLMGDPIEEKLAKALEDTPDSVVVWIPDEEGPLLIPLERLGPLIRNRYHPAARFGTIQVWRRNEARSF